MPAVEDWIGNPLSVVDSLFAKKNSSENFTQDVLEYFKSKINTSSIKLIPSINAVSHHSLRPNSLVRFRCMIQDIFENEYYLGIYEVKNCKTQELYLRSGLFRDSADVTGGEEVLDDSPRMKLNDRLAYYGVSIPGENSWVSQKQKEELSFNMPSTSSFKIREKRQHDDTEDMEVVDDCSQEEVESKRSRSEAQPSSSVNGEDKPMEQRSSPELNFPLPNTSKAPSCIIKYYDSCTFKLNEVIEFIGVLSYDPASKESSSEVSPEHQFRTVYPPSSLVPRVHAIAAVTPHCINGNIQCDVVRADATRHISRPLASICDEMKEKAVQSRMYLQSLLETCFLGDKLAAEYMICHLLSSVYVRKDTLALGKCCLNFSKIPNPTYTASLYDVIKQLIAKSQFLPLLLTTMNDQRFYPKRDPESSKLLSGILQLADNTHVLVDELALTPGQLQPQGIDNLTSLGNVIRWQKLSYDYNFHKGDHECDLPVCVISEGKSLLPSDFHIPIVPTRDWSQMEQTFKEVSECLTPSVLNSVQNYITICRQIDYNVNDEMQTMVQDDFVNMRRNNSSIGADDLHSLLVLARCYSISLGKDNLLPEIWEQVKAMETERKQRIPA